MFLNGEKVVDRYEKKNLPAAGPIVLQHHGNPLEFNNIYIKALPE